MMKNRQIQLIIALLFMSLSSMAQSTDDTLSIQHFGIGGGYYENSNGQSLSYSTGELMTTTVSNYNQILTQGFQQHSFVAVAEIVELADVKIEVTVYPNPTSEFVNIQLKSGSTKFSGTDYKVEFYDLAGKQILFPTTVMEENQSFHVDAREAVTGTYLAKVFQTKEAKMIGTFKITKVAGN